MMLLFNEARISWSTFEPNLNKNGKVIDLFPQPAAFLTSALKKVTFSSKKLVPFFLSVKGENLEYVVGLVKEGKLRTVIDSKHPLSKGEDGWAKSINGHATGKIIVEPWHQFLGIMASLAGKLMQALQFDSYGGGASALKHVEVPVPTPKKNEILVKMEALALNPVDWKIQKGMLRPLFPRKFPYIPGTDVAGEVVEVGQGVNKFKAGDKVLTFLGQANGGGLAEFVVAGENLTVARPPEVSAAEAAGLLVAGLTAHQALTQSAGIKLDGTGEQKNILITAASGGVGQYAVQLAKLGNTHVTATCGARNIELVKSLGADEILDYKTPEGAALKSPSGRKYDAVIHCATGISWSTFEPNLSKNGKVIDITPGPAALLTFALKKVTFSSKQLVPLLMSAKSENMEYLLNLVKEGKLKTVIDSKHPLSKAEDAWAKSIDGHATGKIIVEP
uniref:Enoyl reductase (ER) domain-containing protein n=1 Tax=Cannabis sativa TaxID=3483 RepID=A0A803PFY6_CANSA